MPESRPDIVMTIPEAAERLGAAATLLSLDRTLAFHPAMGVRPTEGTGERLRDAMRWAIERNREAFAANPDVVPDLARPLAEALARDFGDAGPAEFSGWYLNEFVHRAEDFPFYGNWYQFFSRLNATPVRWQQVELPEAVRADAAALFAKGKDVSDLQAIDRQLEGLPLSPWDTQMYTLHRLYAEGREPINWVLETVRKRRFVSYVRWLANRLDEPQRKAFVGSAMLLKRTISTFENTPDFPPLFASME